MRKVSFETLGCRFNQFETAEMAYELSQAGFTAADEGERADVVVINTCTVTGKSDARCRAAIRKARADNPGAKVVVAGCLSEMYPEKVAAEEGVNLVLGNVSKFELSSALKKLEGWKNGPLVITGGEQSGVLPVRPVTNLAGRTNAYIKIQTGCGEVCSFCVVRISRGASVCAEPGAIVNQVRAMAGAGVREVVLTGINLGQYLFDGLSLPGLIRKILNKTDVERIRLSSVNPQHVSDELVGLIAGSARICRHLHIPAQSGSAKVLTLMRRPYSPEFYEGLVNNLARNIPGIGIGADVMVGFPGETETEFTETFDLLNRSPLMMLHVFTYSPRKGTDAFEMSGRPVKDELKRRAGLLKALSAEKRAQAGEKMAGQTLYVLVENTRTARGQLKGFTDNYFPTVFDGPDSLMNTIAPVKILSASATGLSGEFIG
ncbi:MAG: tRNA (N(6)-L-threonylcarbamoyladenosine(37)-C(2))-methylthiotransferase MtaB [Nitrospinae bacterium]|nr:tRNA (N(6)-L-threonylcarbamoyladenosine(37)-C(2))-methylthiotransferase MtaB [Nitrospinota bacterium]